MASPTKKLRIVRKRKEHGRGQKRKSKERSQGSTRSAAELFGDNDSKAQ